MIDVLNKLQNEYSSFNCGELTFQDTKSNLLWVLCHKEIYMSKMINDKGVSFKHQILPLNEDKLEEYNELQKRILEGFEYCINILINNLNEENFSEFNKLAMFLLYKLEYNMLNVENQKKRESLIENFPSKDYHTKYVFVDDKSLFVEMFFVQKFEEITNKSLVCKNV